MGLGSLRPRCVPYGTYHARRAICPPVHGVDFLSGACIARYRLGYPSGESPRCRERMGSQMVQPRFDGAVGRLCAHEQVSSVPSLTLIQGWLGWSTQREMLKGRSASTLCMIFRKQWGYLFNNDPQVVAIVASIMPYIALFQVSNSAETVSGEHCLYLQSEPRGGWLTIVRSPMDTPPRRVRFSARSACTPPARLSTSPRTTSSVCPSVSGSPFRLGLT